MQTSKMSTQGGTCQGALHDLPPRLFIAEPCVARILKLHAHDSLMTRLDVGMTVGKPMRTGMTAKYRSVRLAA